jgi:hypothetical protein
LIFGGTAHHHRINSSLTVGAVPSRQIRPALFQIFSHQKQSRAAEPTTTARFKCKKVKAAAAAVTGDSQEITTEKGEHITHLFKTKARPNTSRALGQAKFSTNSLAATSSVGDSHPDLYHTSSSSIGSATKKLKGAFERNRKKYSLGSLGGPFVSSASASKTSSSNTFLNSPTCHSNANLSSSQHSSSASYVRLYGDEYWPGIAINNNNHDHNSEQQHQEPEEEFKDSNQKTEIQSETPKRKQAITNSSNISQQQVFQQQKTSQRKGFFTKLLVDQKANFENTKDGKTSTTKGGLPFTSRAQFNLKETKEEEFSEIAVVEEEIQVPVLLLQESSSADFVTTE